MLHIHALYIYYIGYVCLLISCYLLFDDGYSKHKRVNTSWQTHNVVIIILGRKLIMPL